jgi:hypothetical protein
MTHVSLDDQPVAVREFFLNWPGGWEGAAVELGGRPVARGFPPPSPANGSAEPSAWTPEQNRRRCELIDRKYAAGLTPDEEGELAVLPSAMHRFIAAAPLPIEAARQLHQELMEKAARAVTGG